MSYAHSFNILKVLMADKKLWRNLHLVDQIVTGLALATPQLVSKVRLAEYSRAWNCSEKLVLTILEEETKIAVKSLKKLLKVYVDKKHQGVLVYDKDPVVNALDTIKTARRHVKDRIKELSKK